MIFYTERKQHLLIRIKLLKFKFYFYEIRQCGIACIYSMNLYPIFLKLKLAQENWTGLVILEFQCSSFARALFTLLRNRVLLSLLNSCRAFLV